MKIPSRICVIGKKYPNKTQTLNDFLFCISFENEIEDIDIEGKRNVKIYKPPPQHRAPISPLEMG